MDTISKMPCVTSNGFDLTKITSADTRNLCATFLDAVKKFYADPVNKKKYEEWNKRRARHENNN